MALYGVGLDITIKKIHLDLKLSIAKQSGKTLKGLEKLFHDLEKNGNGGCLDKKEFELALAKFGFFPKITDLQALSLYYNKDGLVDYHKFMNAVK